VRDNTDVVQTLPEINGYLRCANLVCIYRRTRQENDCECAADHETRRSRKFHRAAAPGAELFSSNVNDAQKLAQFALVPAAAGIMCTALINHIPGSGNLNATRPFVSVRANNFAAGFRRFIATTSAPGSGRPSYVRLTGKSAPACSVYGFFRAMSSS